MKKLLLTVMVIVCAYAGAYSQEEAEPADTEVIEMLDLLETIELLEDEDFELLENSTQMGDMNER